MQVKAWEGRKMEAKGDKEGVLQEDFSVDIKINGFLSIIVLTFRNPKKM